MNKSKRFSASVVRTSPKTILKALGLGVSTVALIGLTLPVPASSAPRPPANAPVPVHEIHDGASGGLPSGTISAGDRFGTSVASSVGDIDGDGTPDVVVGASLDDTGAVDSGAAYVIFLNTDGTAKGRQKLANGVGGFAVGTNKLGDHFGESVAGLGDIDADGIPDIAVSAPGVDVGLVLDRGAVYVLRLNASGQVKAGGTTLLRQGVANIPASTSALTGEHFGSSVAGIGDLNADGVRDIVIGMEGFEINPLSTDEGSAMIVPLQASGAAVAGAAHLVTDGSADLPANSLDLLDGFGNAVAGPGDIDGDGIPDVVVGAHLDDDGTVDHGAVWVLFMRRNGTVRATQKISKTVGGFSSPLGLLETGFATSIGAAGDIDGDGVPDLVVGEPVNDQNGLDNGAVFALYMKADGTVRAYVEFSDGLNGLPRGTIGLGDNFGYGVGGIGDMNADGYPDIAVGAPLDISGGPANGSVFTVGLTALNIAIDPQCAVGSPAATVLAAQSDGTIAQNKVSALDPTGNYLTATEKEVTAVAPALANTTNKVYNFALTSDPFGLLPGSRDVTFPLPTGVGLVPETRIAEPGTALTPDAATLVSGAAIDPATGNLWTYQTVAGVAGMLFRSQDSGATWTGPYSFNAGVNDETQFVNDIVFTADGHLLMIGALYTATDGWRFRTYVMDKMPGTAGAPTGSALDPLDVRLLEDSVAYTGHLTTPGYVPSGVAVVDDSTMWISLDLGGAASLTGGSYIVEYKRVGSAPNVHYEAKIISPVQTVASNPPPAATPLTPAPIATAPLVGDLGIDDLSSCRGFVLQARTVAPVCASVWYDRIDFATLATGVDKDIAIGRLNTTNASTLDLDREVRDAYSIDSSGLPVRQNGFVYGAGLAVGDASGSLNAADTASASAASLFAVPELLNQVKQWPEGADVSQETRVAQDGLSLSSAAAINPADHTLWSGTLVGVDYFVSQRQPGGTWQPLVARAIGPTSAGWDLGQVIVSDFMFSNSGQILVAGYKLNAGPLPFGSADVTLYSVDTSQVLAGGVLPMAVHPIARSTTALLKNGGSSVIDVAFTGLASDPDGRSIYLSAHPQSVSPTRPYFSSSVYKLALANPSPVVPGTLTPIGTGGDIGGIPGWVNDLASCYSTTIATPTAAAILSPISGTLLSTNVAVLNGTGDVGAALVVSDGLGATVCATVVAPDGTWTCLAAGLAEGTSTLTATASNLLGAGTASLPVTLTIDTVIPTLPTITAPATLSLISNTSPNLVGSGEPGATVTVSRGLTTVCSALVSGAGVWSCTPTAALPEGVVTLVPTQADLAGNVSLPGLPTVLTVDSLLPAVPVITSPASGLISSDQTPTLVGTGEAGATVTVKTLAAATVCSGVVDGAGAWSCTPTIALPEGLTTLVPSQADLAGNLSLPGLPWLVTIDSLLPAIPVITSPVSGLLSTDTTPVLIGTGEPGATVTVKTLTGTVICSAVVDGAGAWSCTPTTALPEGLSTLVPTQADLAGNLSLPGVPWLVTIDSILPVIPAITSPVSGLLTTNNTPLLVGSGEAGAMVTVKTLAGVTVCSAVATAGGTWTCTPTTALPEGLTTLVPTQADLAGNVSLPGLPWVVTVDSILPAIPVITSPISGLLSTDSTPALLGTGEAGATVTVKTLTGATICSAIVAAGGAWNCTPTTALPEGLSTLVPTQADLAGNLSLPGLPWLVTVDSLLPAIPVIASPVSGLLSTNSTPALRGTGEAAATVTVKTLAGATICSGIVDGAGAWTCTPTAGLPQGLSTLVPTQADLAGNLSLPGLPWLVTVTAIVPAIPVITSPLSGLLTTDNTPTLLGTGTAGDTVMVKTLAGATICSAVVDSAGAWTCTPTTPLPEGLSTLVPTQADLAGNLSLPGVPWLVTVDSMLPVIPVITAPVSGLLATDNTPLMIGSGEPAATVTVKTLAGATICSAVVNGSGVWNCSPTTALPEGLSTLIPTQADLAGNLSLPGVPWLVTVDSIVPIIPVITSPLSGLLSTDSTPALLGTGEPGATVTVKTLAGATVCSAVVAAGGAWNCTPTTGLPEGLSTLIPTETDLAGNLSLPGLPWVVTVDSILPAIPVITSPLSGLLSANNTPLLVGSGEAAATVTVRTLAGATVCSAVVDGAGTWLCAPTTALPEGLSTLVPTQADLAGNLSLPGIAWLVTVDSILPAIPVITSPLSGLTTTNNLPVLLGSGEPGAAVTVKTLAGATTCSAVVDGAGAWTCTPTAGLPQGLSTLVPTQTDLAGNLSFPGVPWLVTVTAILPAIPVITSPLTGLLTTDNTPTLLGTATAGDTATVKTLAGATICSAVVDSAGAWTCTPTTPLPEGLTTLIPTQADLAGNLSLPGLPWVVTVDSILPIIPVITTPVSGLLSINSTPALLGTGEAGATVTVKTLAGATTCSAVVTAGGTWNCTPTTPLPQGLSTLIPTQADLAGNLSLPGVPWLVTVDSILPAIPVITSPVTGLLNTDNTPTLTGTGEAGAIVTVKTLAGATICSAVVAAGGAWNCTPTTGLSEGLSTLIPTQADPAGNLSLPGIPWLVTVDSILPAIPVITSPLSGLISADGLFTFAGLGEPGANMKVATPAGSVACTAAVAAGGTWTCTPAGALPEGLVTFVPTQTDPAGNTSLPGVPWLATVHYPTPAPASAVPVITSPTTGSTISDSTPTVAGTGAAGETISVMTIGGAPLCVSPVDASSAWSCTTLTPLAEGVVTIVAKQSNILGTATGSSNPVVLTLDSAAPAVPTINPTDGSIFSGSAEPGSTIVIGSSTSPWCSVTVPSSGSWTCTPSPIVPLNQVLQVIARDPAGNVSAEQSVSVNALYELAISITGEGNRRKGTTSKLLVSIRNLGPKDAADAVVKLTLPPGVEFGPVSTPKSSQGSKAATGLKAATELKAATVPPSCTPTDPSTLTCALGIVRLNQVLNMDVTVRTTANLTQNQTIMSARVTGIGQEAVTANNVAEAKATGDALTLPTTGTNPLFMTWLAGILTSAGIVLLAWKKARTKPTATA